MPQLSSGPLGGAKDKCSDRQKDWQDIALREERVSRCYTTTLSPDAHLICVSVQHSRKDGSSMKQRFSQIQSSFLLLVCVNTLQGQWTTNVPFSGNQVLAVLANGRNILAGTIRGIYQSRDGGANWIQAPLGNPQWAYPPYIFSLAQDGPRILAGTSAGLYGSTDNGTTWDTVSVALPTNTINCVYARGEVLLVGTAAEGAFLSTNDGSSWSAVNTGLTNPDVLSFCIKEASIFAGTFGGVFRSDNKGASWTQVDSGFTSGNVTSFLVLDSTIFAGTSGIGGGSAGIFLSTDNGLSWTARNSGLTNSALKVASLFSADGFIFAGTQYGVFRSSNHGANWSSTSPYGSPVSSVAANDSVLFAGNYSGILVSNDSGATWSVPGISLGNVWGLSVDPSLQRGQNLFVGGSAGSFISSNFGRNWIRLGSGLSHTYVNTYAFDGNNIFAGTQNGILLSSDTGNTWTSADSGITNFTDVRSIVVRGGDLLAATSRGIYRSDSNATTWITADSGLSNLDVKSLVASGDSLFAGTFGGGIYLSTNDGAFWTPIDSGLTNRSVFALAVHDKELFAGTYGGGVFHSTDGGATWSSSGLTEMYVYAFGFYGRNIIAGGEVGIYLSTDDGASWSSIGANLANDHILSIAIDDDILYVGTSGGGVWRCQITQLLTGVKTQSLLPLDFLIWQNFPNPFNPSTMIRYQIPSSARVSIRIYNLLGQELANLVDEQKQPGVYSLEWNASNFPSGIYFYQLRAGSIIQTRKMLLIK